MFSIIVSKKDPAGLNIKNFLLKNFDFVETTRTFDENPIFEMPSIELITINQFQIFADYLDKLNTDFFIFASKHESESKRPTLTVHPIGNFGEAKFGGKENTLVNISAILMKNFLISLANKKSELNLPYEVSLEATHHGPYLTKPAIFIELGSSTEQWKDKKAASVIAETIVQHIVPEDKKNLIFAIAFGGLHYCPEFTKLVLRKNYAISHICAQHSLQFLNDNLLWQMITRTKESVQEIVYDGKGLGKYKQKLLYKISQLNLPIKDVRKII